MILKEQNNQEKILTDRVLDVNHEPENMPSASGKASLNLALCLVLVLPSSLCGAVGTSHQCTM